MSGRDANQRVLIPVIPPEAWRKAAEGLQRQARKLGWASGVFRSSQSSASGVAPTSPAPLAEPEKRDA